MSRWSPCTSTAPSRSVPPEPHSRLRSAGTAFSAASSPGSPRHDRDELAAAAALVAPDADDAVGGRRAARRSPAPASPAALAVAPRRSPPSVRVDRSASFPHRLPVYRRAPGSYAPSPSGPMHLGNARTALLAWLQARAARRAHRAAHRRPRRRALPARARRGGRRGPRLARAWTGTARCSCQSAARRALRRGARRARRAGPGLRVLLHPGRAARAGDRAARRVGARAALPRHLPRADGRRARRPPRGRPRRRAAPARASRSPCASDDLLHGSWSSTSRRTATSRCGAPTACTRTRWRPWSTTRASGGHRRAARRRPARADRRARCCCSGCSGCRRRPTATCRCCTGADGARLAKRHGAVAVARPARAGVPAAGGHGLAGRHRRARGAGRASCCADALVDRFAVERLRGAAATVDGV